MTSWASFVTAASLCSIFFAVLGLVFVALCAVFDDRAKSPLKWIGPASRVVVSSFCAMIISAILFYWVAVISEYDDSMDALPTVVEEIVRSATIVAMWVIIVGLDIFPGLYLSNTATYSYLVTLFLLNGFFWGLVVEAIFYLRARWKGRRQKAPN